MEMRRSTGLNITMKTRFVPGLALAIILFALFSPGKAVARVAHNGAAEHAIRDVLRRQVQAWNRGDVDAFMNGYARSDKTTFVSGDDVHHGWNVVLERYKKRYPDKARMGTLAFSDLDISTLSPDAAVASGQWHLKRAHDNPHGRFTLILCRLPEGWRIVHDHTSSAEPKK
jgi:ketosteroid isomerase-like protein